MRTRSVTLPPDAASGRSSHVCQFRFLFYRQKLANKKMYSIVWKFFGLRRHSVWPNDITMFAQHMSLQMGRSTEYGIAVVAYVPLRTTSSSPSFRVHSKMWRWTNIFPHSEHSWLRWPVLVTMCWFSWDVVLKRIEHSVHCFVRSSVWVVCRCIRNGDLRTNSLPHLSHWKNFSPVCNGKRRLYTSPQMATDQTHIDSNVQNEIGPMLEYFSSNRAFETIIVLRNVSLQIVRVSFDLTANIAAERRRGACVCLYVSMQIQFSEEGTRANWSTETNGRLCSLNSIWLQNVFWHMPTELGPVNLKWQQKSVSNVVFVAITDSVGHRMPWIVSPTRISCRTVGKFDFRLSLSRRHSLAASLSICGAVIWCVVLQLVRAVARGEYLKLLIEKRENPLWRDGTFRIPDSSIRKCKSRLSPAQTRLTFLRHRQLPSFSIGSLSVNMSSSSLVACVSSSASISPSISFWYLHHEMQIPINLNQGNRRQLRCTYALNSDSHIDDKT